MKTKIIKKVFLWAGLVLSVVLGLTPHVLAPVCQMSRPDGTPMMCYYSAIFIAVIAGVAALISLIAILTKKKVWNYTSYIFVFLSGVLSYLVPNRIIPIGDKTVAGWEFGLCRNAQMACREHTMPLITILMVLMIVVSVVGIFVEFLLQER